MGGKFVLAWYRDGDGALLGVAIADTLENVFLLAGHAVATAGYLQTVVAAVPQPAQLGRQLDAQHRAVRVAAPAPDYVGGVTVRLDRHRLGVGLARRRSHDFHFCERKMQTKSLLVVRMVGFVNFLFNFLEEQKFYRYVRFYFRAYLCGLLIKKKKFRRTKVLLIRRFLLQSLFVCLLIFKKKFLEEQQFYWYVRFYFRVYLCGLCFF